MEAVLGLMPRVFALPWDAALCHNVLDHLDNLVAAVPAFRLRCRPDADAVAVLRESLEDVFLPR